MSTHPLKPVPALNYVTVPKAHTYRAIVQVFFDAKQHYAIELRPADVLARLQSAGLYTELQDPNDPEPELHQLVQWGNLKASHDTASVSRLEDFYRHRLLYHLTPVGEAAHRAVLDVEATVGKSGSLQATMLAKIRDALVSLATLADLPSPTPDDVLRALHDLHSGFDTLTVEANRFITDLDSTTKPSDQLAERRFLLYKDALLAYIGRFVEQLRRLGDDIRASIGALSAAPVERLLVTAAHSADLPPALGDTDPVAVWVAEQRARWAGIRVWFLGDPLRGTAPTVDRLADVATEAVVALTRTLQRLNEQRSRPVDRAADFRTLARWFAACADERAAHRLFHAAFGLSSTRHFHLEEVDPELNPPNSSFFDADPVEVPVRLRTRGSVPTQGRPGSVTDHAATRQWIAARRRREREALEAAAKRFVDRGALAFDELGFLDAEQFEVFLTLLDEALTAPARPDGTRETRSADGSWLIRLTPPPQDDVELVEIMTPRGTLCCRNFRIAVVDALRSPASARERAPR